MTGDEAVHGLARVALPVGVNAVESVNMYVLADGDRVTLVDCGVWRPDLPDGGLDAVEAGVERLGMPFATSRGSSSPTRTSTTTGSPGA